MQPNVALYFYDWEKPHREIGIDSRPVIDENTPHVIAACQNNALLLWHLIVIVCHNVMVCNVWLTWTWILVRK